MIKRTLLLLLLLTGCTNGPNIDLAKLKNDVDTILNEYSFKNKLTESAVFIYGPRHETRFLLSSDADIKNPVTNTVQTDSLWKKLYLQNKHNHCTTTATLRLPLNSELRPILLKKGLVKPETYYMACPIFNQDLLIGYVSAVVKVRDSNVSGFRHLLEIQSELRHLTIKISEITS